ncbi:Uncharacterised protein [Mycobacteroides abscessus subsp. abscessus]|nr:Uncharacterised protein [Mycobacteroides abscessus subsp. abscessus]
MIRFFTLSAPPSYLVYQFASAPPWEWAMMSTSSAPVAASTRSTKVATCLAESWM